MGWIRSGAAVQNQIRFLRFRHFVQQSALESEVVIFFRTLCLVLFWAKPYYRNARINRGIIFGFRRNLRNYCKLPVRSGFLGVSLISVFSLYFINILGHWISLETGALYCLLGLCLICRGFVGYVGFLYCLLGLCIVCWGFV